MSFLARMAGSLAALRAERQAAEASKFLGLFNRNVALEQDVMALNETVALRDEEIAGLREEVGDLSELIEAGKAIEKEYRGEISRLKAALSEASARADSEQSAANHARHSLREAQRERDLSRLQVDAYRDAVELFADRAKATPEELAQLNLGTLIPGAGGGPDQFVFGDLEDAKSSIDFAMKNQATVAKFRQLKEHFLKHQQAVTIMLDQITAITRKNQITAEDHNKLRNMRDALSSLIRRSI